MEKTKVIVHNFIKYEFKSVYCD